MANSSGSGKSIVVGAVAGLFASFVMDRFQEAWARSSPTSLDNDGDKEPATIQVADKMCLTLSGKAIPETFRPFAGNAVHYCLGGALGAIYGYAAHLAPAATAGAGSAYSTAVWLGLDEGLLPILGFGDTWAEVPFGKHVYGLISHVVFGLSLEGTRRLLKHGIATDSNPDYW